ncbi:hypothetical protein EGI26_04475 [Lacihabitans sp. CCS-44]|nr:hypothetical protein [Lacihabitans sp. CCS-44]
MNMIKTIFRDSVVYENIFLLLIYSLFCIAKIYFQIFFDPPLQVLFLVGANILLTYPFFKANFFQPRVSVLWYFLLITIGEIIIVFYEDLDFLKLGMSFYLFSKIALILVFRNTLKDFRLTKLNDFLKILGPQVMSFAIGYMIYNDSNLDISISFLIIIDAVVQALVFSYIFYFKNASGVNFVRAGLVFLSLHDVFGGFNIFNHNVDKDFVVSFVLISTGNFILGYGLWKSRVVDT